MAGRQERWELPMGQPPRSGPSHHPTKIRHRGSPDPRQWAPPWGQGSSKTRTWAHVWAQLGRVHGWAEQGCKHLLCGLVGVGADIGTWAMGRVVSGDACLLSQSRGQLPLHHVLPCKRQSWLQHSQTSEEMCPNHSRELS